MLSSAVVAFVALTLWLVQMINQTAPIKVFKGRGATGQVGSSRWARTPRACEAVLPSGTSAMVSDTLRMRGPSPLPSREAEVDIGESLRGGIR